MFLLDAKQSNTSIPYGGRGVSSHPEEVSFESGSMVRSPHISKKKNSKDIAEKSQEGKFKRNDSSNEVRSLQFDPLEGSSSHNLPSERLSNKGVSKKSKKSDLLQICVDEIYKPVFCNETKPNQTKPNQTKPNQTKRNKNKANPTKLVPKQLPGQTPPKTFEQLLEDSLYELNKSQIHLDKPTIKNISNSFNLHMGKIVSLFYKENALLMKKVSSQLNLYIKTFIYKYSKTGLIGLDKPAKQIYKELSKSTDEYITTIESEDENKE